MRTQVSHWFATQFHGTSIHSWRTPPGFASCPSACRRAPRTSSRRCRARGSSARCRRCTATSCSGVPGRSKIHSRSIRFVARVRRRPRMELEQLRDRQRLRAASSLLYSYQSRRRPCRRPSLPQLPAVRGHVRRRDHDRRRPRRVGSRRRRRSVQQGLHLPEGHRARRSPPRSGSPAPPGDARRRRRWREVGWDEAFDLVAARLARDPQARTASDAIAVYQGNPTVHNLGLLTYGQLLLRTLGTRNLYSATSLDQLPHMLAALLDVRQPAADAGARHRSHAICSSASAPIRSRRTAAS